MRRASQVADRNDHALEGVPEQAHGGRRRPVPVQVHSPEPLVLELPGALGADDRHPVAAVHEGLALGPHSPVEWNRHVLDHDAHVAAVTGQVVLPSEPHVATCSASSPSGHRSSADDARGRTARLSTAGTVSARINRSRSTDQFST